VLSCRDGERRGVLNAQRRRRCLIRTPQATYPPRIPKCSMNNRTPPADILQLRLRRIHANYKPLLAAHADCIATPSGSAPTNRKRGLNRLLLHFPGWSVMENGQHLLKERETMHDQRSARNKYLSHAKTLSSPDQLPSATCRPSS